MAENTSRNVFGLSGVTGMLIATVLLLSILVFLTVWGIAVQQNEATNYYTIENPADLKLNDRANADHFKSVK